MVLIIEGPDGAGKTTFAKQFVGATYHHEGPPPQHDGNLVDYYQSLLLDAHEDGGVHVFDRLAMSEIVYGPVLRDKSRIDRGQWRQFEGFTRGLGIVTIVCLPPKAACAQAWAEKLSQGRELISDPVKFSKVYEHFAAIAVASNYPVYDWTKR